MEIDFRGAARIDDVLTIETRTAEISGARVKMAQTIKRGDDLLISAAVEAALINNAGRPRRAVCDHIESFCPMELGQIHPALRVSGWRTPTLSGSFVRWVNIGLATFRVDCL
eukprot:gene29419-36018_t